MYAGLRRVRLARAAAAVVSGAAICGSFAFIFLFIYLKYFYLYKTREIGAFAPTFRANNGVSLHLRLRPSGLARTSALPSAFADPLVFK